MKDDIRGEPIGLLGSVLVKASRHSGGLLHVEAKAWSSAEVVLVLSNNVRPFETERLDPEGLGMVADDSRNTKT